MISVAFTLTHLMEMSSEYFNLPDFNTDLLPLHRYSKKLHRFIETRICIILAKHPSPISKPR